jgi:WXG100 family type VII secretion target
MANAFSVNTESVQKSVQIIDEKVSALVAQAKTLNDEVTNLSVEWKGNASAQFNAELAQYQETMSKMATTLSAFANAITESLNTYDSADSDLAEKAKAIANLTAQTASQIANML